MKIPTLLIGLAVLLSAYAGLAFGYYVTARFDEQCEARQAESTTRPSDLPPPGFSGPDTTDYE